ncbi:hypothetical protein JYU34_020212 [Plutella xylostella]|uniref:Uncharacterized protein n=1 Tax=Plutella xylostella TaxID=51655 RepID=A0ABQ7PUA4_PLUXY|nr:hypothetical protein JYU34_020212 [Plutella xylostella]
MLSSQKCSQYSRGQEFSVHRSTPGWNSSSVESRIMLRFFLSTLTVEILSLQSDSINALAALLYFICSSTLLSVSMNILRISPTKETSVMSSCSASSLTRSGSSLCVLRSKHSFDMASGNIRILQAPFSVALSLSNISISSVISSTAFLAAFSASIKSFILFVNILLLLSLALSIIAKALSRSPCILTLVSLALSMCLGESIFKLFSLHCPVEYLVMEYPSTIGLTPVLPAWGVQSMWPDAQGPIGPMVRKSPLVVSVG